MKIDEIPIFCITLKNTHARTAYAKDLFQRMNLNVQFFYGIDGSLLNVDSFHVYETVQEDKSGWKIRNGVIGGSWSHMLLWNVIWRLGYQEAIIFEDDVEFIDMFKENFELTYAEIPSNYDVFYLGGIYDPQNSGEKISFSSRLMKYRPVCMHAYMIRQHILKPLIQTAAASLIDLDYGILAGHPNLNVYVAHPLLVTEKSFNNGNRAKEGIWVSLSNPEHFGHL